MLLLPLTLNQSSFRFATTSEMAPGFKAIIFDLGGVLLDWDRHSANALSADQFLAIMNSTAWHNLDRGKITLKQACKVSLLHQPYDQRKA